MAAHAWSDLPSVLDTALPKANEAAKTDGQLKAFTKTDAIDSTTTFGIKSGGSDSAILVSVSNSKIDIRSGSAKEAVFTLNAQPEQWQEFMKQTPVMPYQSYWAIKRQIAKAKADLEKGMFGMNIKQEGISIEGDQLAFAQWTHVWRRVLELIHDAHSGVTPADEDPETDEDHIVGRYTYIKAPLWGRCKVFYEQAGEGDIDIVFLHTAGSDSRQYHGVMNDERMRKKCRMTAFDLPAHGRSFPYEHYWPGKHTNTEDAYVGCLAAFVKKLGLMKPIICGASMAGQLSICAAIRYKEIGCAGTIPLQGSDYLNMDRTFSDKSPHVNQALFAPEWIYGKWTCSRDFWTIANLFAGMMSPTAPLKNRQLIWHMYSAQAYAIFHGDLDFYFGGWDGRDRVALIDCKACPVYMLTGEYDWSNTPDMAQKTADKIPGAKHQAMKGLGHFPATENPRAFVGYLLEAIDHIVKTRS